jgi:tRNA threonylcarbamoyl adenosine modification protein YeaZ
MSSYGLAIHTASTELGLAISRFARGTCDDVRFQVWDLGRETANLLQAYLLEFLQPQIWQDLAFIAVAKGPGGFTGTRIGVVTARTLAQQLEVPLFAISTLAAVAWEPSRTLVQLTESQLVVTQSITPQSRAIAVQMPAQRDEIFAACYQAKFPAEHQPAELITHFPDTLITPDQWEEWLSQWSNQKLDPEWSQETEQGKKPYHRVEVKNSLGATVASVLDLAHLEWQQGKRPHWSEALPFYGQNPC